MKTIQQQIKTRAEQLSTLPPELQKAIQRGRDNIEYFAEHLLGMPTHNGQKKFYRYANQKINTLVPANRWGKTVTIAIKHIHKNFYKIGIPTGNMKAWLGVQYRTANIAPHSAMTEPCFVIMKQILTSSFPIIDQEGNIRTNDCKIRWFYDKDRTINTPPYKITYVNRSETIFRSLGQDMGDALQGKPYGYISYDEGGRSDHLEREVNDNILPRLTDWGGELDIVSTPDMNSPSILYHYDLYQHGLQKDPGFYTQEGALVDNTFLPAEEVKKQYALYEGNPIAPQVLEGKFVFEGGNLFPQDDVLAAIDDKLNDGLRYEEGGKYYIGVDTAIGEDEMVFTVLKEPKEIGDNYELVRLMAAKGASKSPQMHLNDFLDLVDSYNKGSNVKIILETWNGESARFYQDLPQNIQQKTTCYGSWQPPGITDEMKKNRVIKKADIIIALRKLLADQKIKIPNDRELKSQLSIYREDDKKLNTDRVISLALACYLATDGKPKNTKIIFQEVDW